MYHAFLKGVYLVLGLILLQCCIDVSESDIVSLSNCNQDDNELPKQIHLQI